MARLLFCWELGGAMGHLATLQTVAESLAGQSHEIAVVARELRLARKFSETFSQQWFQAPLMRYPTGRQGFLVRSYPQLLFQSAFRNFEELSALVMAWHSLITDWKPDLLVVDHSPVAVIAADLLDIPVVAVGSGFKNPPKETEPFGVFPYLSHNEGQRQGMRQDEAFMLNIINRLRETFGRTPYEKFADLYRGVDYQLMTLPELDHYGSRSGEVYLGVPHATFNQPIHWKTGLPKVFAYLRNFGGVPALLQQVVNAGFEVAVYCNELSAEERNTLAHPALQFCEQPVSMQQVAEDTCFYIGHGGHTTLCQLYMQGTPQLLLPLHQEQMMSAWQYEKTGCGHWLDIRKGDYQAAIASINKPEKRQRAQAAREKYQGFSFQESREKMADFIAGKLAHSASNT